jgi:mitogen-activated protein kinase kinase kinase 7
LDKNYGTAKVCDFGAAKTIVQKTMTGNVGTLSYMSPEVIRHKSYGEKCDVYSFGIIMFELFFEMDAYTNPNESDFGNLFNLAIEVTKGKRPIIPDSIEFSYTEQEDKYFVLMKKCWQEEAEGRPTFLDLYEELEYITSKL